MLRVRSAFLLQSCGTWESSCFEIRFRPSARENTERWLRSLTVDISHTTFHQTSSAVFPYEARTNEKGPRCVNTAGFNACVTWLLQ